MMRLGMLCLIAAVCGVAFADQAAYITREQAERAAGLIGVGAEIRHFAPPAGDTTWRSETVESKSAQPAGYENYYEVKVNGQGIDLAYVYILEGDRWVNLAMRTGLDVVDVPEALGEEDEAGENDFARNGYKGLINGKLGVYMELGRTGNTLTGSYSYASKGIPIQLEGSVDKEGSFTLTEFADEKKTGLFTGKLSSDATKFEGEWISADGSRHLPFSGEKYCELAEEDIAVKLKKGDIEGHLAFPKFLMKDTAVSDKLTRHIRNALREDYGTFEDDARTMLEEMEPRPDLESLVLSFDTSDYEVTFFSDTLVSVVFTIYSYAGGAHPNNYFRVFNLHIPPQGEIHAVYLDDFFKEGTDPAKLLSERLVADLRKQEAQWVVDGELKEFKKEELGGAVVTPRGLRFVFSPYAVGPYAQGPFQVDVSYDVLGDSLDREGPLKAVF